MTSYPKQKQIKCFFNKFASLVARAVYVRLFPPASEASREVANLTEKNPHPPYMVSKNLSVCLSGRDKL